MAFSDDLPPHFRRYVDAFGEGKRIVGIYLFGIEFGENLSHLSSADCKRLAAKAGFKESLGTELHKAIRLAPYASRR